MGHYKINFAVSSENVLNDINTGKAEYGLVALNNSQGGLVNETIKALGENKYLIVDSVVYKVEHSLIARVGVALENVKKIYSHPQALKQCKEYLAKHYPDCEYLPYKDTALAAIDLAAGKLPADGIVIAHRNNADDSSLQLIAENIQDLGSDNETLFLLISGNKNATK